MAQIKLTKGFFAKVDDQDVEILNVRKWCVMGPVNGGYYAVSRIDYELVSMSRWLMRAQKGDYVDHVNGDTLDNRRSNLRLCRDGVNVCGANSINIRNSKLSKRNKTGVRGVRWDEKRKAFIVEAKVNGKRFQRQAKTLEEASKMHREFMEAELKQDYDKEIYPKQYAQQDTSAA